MRQHPPLFSYSLNLLLLLHVSKVDDIHFSPQCQAYDLVTFCCIRTRFVDSFISIDGSTLLGFRLFEKRHSRVDHLNFRSILLQPRTLSFFPNVNGISIEIFYRFRRPRIYRRSNSRMDKQAPLRILSLDGGGVRGISSLYILKELMAQINRQRRSENQNEPTSVVEPCDVFDLICGTSTGGLIAIMLGRLKMVCFNRLVLINMLTELQTVDQAIAKYSELSETIFTTSLKSKTAKFDHTAFENILKKVVAESQLNLQPDALLKEPNSCKTFVVAIRTRGGGATAVRMRTYDTNTADAFPARIWEAARATSAAPTFFQPITINRVQYGDGGTGWNNPTAEALAEAHHIWPSCPIGCLLSLGTGLEDAIQLSEGNDKVSQGFSRSLLQKLAPQASFQLEVAKYCVASLTSCEKIHREISEKFPERIVPNRNYFRFNVPQGMSKIGLEEWKKVGDIIALTEDYMDHGEILEQKKTVARVLLNPQLAG